jgi:hypothetical protein
VNIIKARIERMVRLSIQASVRQREVANGKRRPSYRKGQVTLPHYYSCRLSTEIRDRLEAMAALMNVEKGAIFRDALRMYLDIAEEEFAKDEPPESARTHLRQPGYVR